MNRTELDQFQGILNAKHGELTRAMGKRDGIAIERSADVMDDQQLASMRELTTGNLERASNVLRAVRAALGRIADGTYGICLECEDEISHKRLRAVPWASLCIGCQEEADRGIQANFASYDTLLRKAA
jgi:DnaK suppressor protein